MATVSVELSDVAKFKDEDLVPMAIVGEYELPLDLTCSSRLDPTVLPAQAPIHLLIHLHHLTEDNPSILPPFDWLS